MVEETKRIDIRLGHGKHAGRPKGSRHYRVAFLGEVLNRKGIDWQTELASAIKAPPDDPIAAKRLQTLLTLVPYLVPRLVTRDVESPKPTVADSVKNAEVAKRLLDELEGRQPSI